MHYESSHHINIVSHSFRFHWQRTNSLFGESVSAVEWEIPQDAQLGLYRIRHFGHHKDLMQQIKSYIGVSLDL
jgi:neutral ceramidase